jgi:hypothetical protein
MNADYAVWRPFFAKALDDRFYRLSDLDLMILNGARFWSNDKAAIVAEIKTYPTGNKVVEGVVAAGALADIVALIPLAEAWGRENGAIAAKIESRAGWIKTLRKQGWEPFQAALVKGL